MKRFTWILAFVCIASATVYGAGETASTRSPKHNTPFPYKYPLALAHILAPFGVAEAQALVGMEVIHADPCKGVNWLQRAAKQHHLFAEMQLLGYYHVTGKRDRDAERLKMALLWYLPFQGHFPDEPDDSRVVVAMLKLTSDQEAAVRERAKTWKPQDEPPVEPASCAGKPFSWYED